MGKPGNYDEAVDLFQFRAGDWAEGLLGTVEKLAGQLYLLRTWIYLDTIEGTPEDQLALVRKVAKNMAAAASVLEPASREFDGFELPARPEREERI